jgi:hypothetical protein
MQRPVLALSVIVCGLLVTPSQADDARQIVLTAEFRSEASARSLATSRRPDASIADRTLAVSERVRFSGPDPTLGPLIKARIELNLRLDYDFEGVIGDGVPLEEASDPVALEGRVRTRIDVVAPNGSFLHSEVVEGAPAGCSGIGICAFSHQERHALDLAFDLKPSAVSVHGEPSFSIRATTIGGVLTQLCTPEGVWDRCQVRLARLTLSAPENGVRLIHSHMPSGSLERSEVSESKSSVVRGQPDTVLVILGSLMLASVVLLARYIWIMQRERRQGYSA